MRRGRNYSTLRRLGEGIAKHAYAFSWPGRLWAHIPGATTVTRIQHDLALGRGGRPPLRVAFASDLHIGPTTARETLDNAFDELRRIAPDVLVLGGDYVYLEATAARVAELRDRVASVPAPTKLAVLGNHDLWTHHLRIEDALRSGGAAVLINEAVRLPPPHDDVAFLGLDDPWTGDADGDRAAAAAGDAPIRLAVCHSPDGLPHVRGRGVSLMVCGHTHGGQIALPGHRPVVVPGIHGKEWPFGFHPLEDGLCLFVSRGVGTVEVPLRTFAPPDVALFTIT